MAKEIKMPRLGLTMSEGLIIEWLKQEGDYVKAGDEIVQIESDKSTTDYESPEEGYLLKILYPGGETVECQKAIAILGEKGEIFVLKEEAAIKEATAAETAPDAPPAMPVVREEPLVEEMPVFTGGRVPASPAAKRVAKEKGIDISVIPLPQGKKRLEQEDVLQYVEAAKVKATPLAKKIAQEQGIDLAGLGKGGGERVYSSDLSVEKSGAGVDIAARADKHIPITGMRKVIATRMKASIEAAAHISLTTEVDMTNVLLLRSKLVDGVQAKYGVKPSVNDIVIKCAAKALEEYPRVNSTIVGNEIIELADINVGMAVALGDGLIVPVIKNANNLSIGEIAKKSKALAEKGRSKGLDQQEMSGGTFTVSNLGMYGITSFTSIINQPESAILSVAQIVKRVVPGENGEISVVPMMNLTINLDHRAVDGAVGAQFLKRLKELLEEPAGLLV